MKKMTDFKDLFFITNFEEEPKLRCHEFYYLLGSTFLNLLNNLKLGKATPKEVKDFILKKYNIESWLFVLEEKQTVDIKEYAYTDVFIDGRNCFAFNVEIAFHS